MGLITRITNGVYDHLILDKIGNTIGQLLRIDIYTKDAKREQYVHQCLQVAIDQPLITSYILEIIINQLPMKEYHYCVIIVEGSDTRQHFAHMHDYPIPIKTILKQQQGYRDMTCRTSTQTWQILETLILSHPLHSPFILHPIPYETSIQKIYPIPPIADQKILFQRYNHGPWMIVHYPKKS